MGCASSAEHKNGAVATTKGPLTTSATKDQSLKDVTGRTAYKAAALLLQSQFVHFFGIPSPAKGVVDPVIITAALLAGSPLVKPKSSEEDAASAEPTAPASGGALPPAQQPAEDEPSSSSLSKLTSQEILRRAEVFYKSAVLAFDNAELFGPNNNMEVETVGGHMTQFRIALNEATKALAEQQKNAKHHHHHLHLHHHDRSDDIVLPDNTLSRIIVAWVVSDTNADGAMSTNEIKEMCNRYNFSDTLRRQILKEVKKWRRAAVADANKKPEKKPATSSSFSLDSLTKGVSQLASTLTGSDDIGGITFLQFQESYLSLENFDELASFCPTEPVQKHHHLLHSHSAGAVPAATGTEIDPATAVMSVDEALTFVHTLQNQSDVTREAFLKALLNATGVTPTSGSGVPDTIPRRAFFKLLASVEYNSVIDADKAALDEKSMDEPLCSYLINAGHNSYLTGDQLTSNSSVDMYRIALEDGCRCVELDCWEAGYDAHGVPQIVIYHGYTATSKIKAEDVAATIAEYAFKTSPYPVFLSLEIHLGIEHQAQLAKIFVEKFGKLLAIPRPSKDHDGEYPHIDGAPYGLKNGEKLDYDACTQIKLWDESKITPAALKNHIVLKGKRGKSIESLLNLANQKSEAVAADVAVATAEAVAEDPLDDDEDLTDPVTHVETAGDDNVEPKPEYTKQKKKGESVPMSPLKGLTPDLQAKVKEAKAKKEHAKPSTIAQELTNLIIMAAVHFDATGKSRKVYNCTSFGEAKSMSRGDTKKKATAAIDYIKLNAECVSRVYPSGARIDSSNFHPMPHWAMGCQLAAMNWQTVTSYELRMNKFKFLFDNGNSGYALKCPSMRGSCEVAKPNKISADNISNPKLAPAAEYIDPKIPTGVTISAISAFNLPKPDRETTGEVVDPYVRIFLEGPYITGRTDRQKVLLSHTIDDNGFHPVWAGKKKQNGCVATLPLYLDPARTGVSHEAAWDLSMLVVQIYDEDLGPNPDDFLAEVMIPLKVLREGVRSFPLFDEKTRRLASSCFLSKIEFVYESKH